MNHNESAPRYDKSVTDLLTSHDLLPMDSVSRHDLGKNTLERLDNLIIGSCLRLVTCDREALSEYHRTFGTEARLFMVGTDLATIAKIVSATCTEESRVDLSIDTLIETCKYNSHMKYSLRDVVRDGSIIMMFGYDPIRDDYGLNLVTYSYNIIGVLIDRLFAMSHDEIVSNIPKYEIVTLGSSQNGSSLEMLCQTQPVYSRECPAMSRFRYRYDLFGHPIGDEIVSRLGKIIINDFEGIAKRLEASRDESK